MDRDKV